MLLLDELETGKWYMALVCVCTVRSIIFPDASNGKGATRGTYLVTCPACGRRGWYHAEHYYHDPKPMSEESKAVN
jgi:hypothetical protein